MTKSQILICVLFFLMQVFVAGLFVKTAIDYYRGNTTEWKEYSYPEDGFKARFNAIPKVDVDQKEGGRVAVYTSGVKSEGYVVTVLTLPYEPDFDRIDGSLKSSAEKTVSNMGFQLKTTSIGTYNNYKSVDFGFEKTGDAVYGRGKYFLNGKVLYGVIVISEKPDSKEFDKFLGGFQLLNETTPQIQLSPTPKPTVRPTRVISPTTFVQPTSADPCLGFDFSAPSTSVKVTIKSKSNYGNGGKFVHLATTGCKAINDRSSATKVNFVQFDNGETSFGNLYPGTYYVWVQYTPNLVSTPDYLVVTKSGQTSVVNIELP